MTTPVVTTGLDASVEDIAQLLGRYHISAVAVVDPFGALAGIVTEYDLLAKQGSTAAVVMTTTVVTVTDDADVEEVRNLLVDQHVGQVPVLAGGRFVGATT